MLNFRYDMLIIDNISLRESEIKDYLDTFNSKINSYILVNRNIKYSLDNWNIKNYDNWVEIIKDRDQLISESYLNDYRQIYNLFNNMINLLDENKIEYRLCGYDCLTCYLFNAHSIFTKNIEICIHKMYKDKLKEIYSPNIINSGNGFIIVQKYPLIVKISFFYTTSPNENQGKFIFIENNFFFNIEEAGSMPLSQNYGPIRCYTFKNPVPYLSKRFGINFIFNIKYPIFEEKIYDSSILYKDCADFYSQNRSDIWRKELITAGKEVAQIFSDAGIKYWLDGGSLLGAIRNRDIPLGDDDLDLGIFTNDLNKVYNLKLPDGFTFLGKLSNGCVIKKLKNNIYYYVEILAYFKNEDNKYQCNRYMDTKSMKNRAYKCAVPCEYYDVLENIQLGDYNFPCPQLPSVYVELPQRYGKGCINSDPKPHVKSGNQNWVAFFGTDEPGISY